MIEFVICDDNNIILESVNNVIKSISLQSNFCFNTRSFDDYNETFNVFLKNNKEKVIYILDIETPSKSGIDVAKEIRKIDKRSIIIFLTSHDELAYDIIKQKLSVLTFVSKAFNYEVEIEKAIINAIEYFDYNDCIKFTDFKSSYCINLNSILYITKDYRKTVIITDEKNYSVYVPMSKIKEMLPNYFFQSHRACIVNTKRISVFDYGDRVIYFDNDMEIDLVSDTYRKDLMKECRK